MARIGLSDNIKFRRMVRLLKIPRPYVRGLLESMWEVGWQNVNPVLGSSLDVELAAEWPGEIGHFTAAAVESGFLDEERGIFTIHDFWDHVPDYVVKRYRRKQVEEKKRRAEHSIMEDGGQRRTTADNGELRPPVLSCPVPASPVPSEEEDKSTSATEPADPTAFTPDQLLALWNDYAILAHLPSCRKLTGSRRRAAKTRLTENPDPAYWADVVKRISRSSFCRGLIPGRGWRATFNWLIQPDTGTKVLEGTYDDQTRTQPPASKTAGNIERAKSVLRNAAQPAELVEAEA